jgi:23S rRNA (adenine-N6)-dimethyltransferase
VSGRARADRSAPVGQHFLGSAQLAARLVVDADVGPDDRVLDLGAGTGVLTAALAARASVVLAIEIDPLLARGLARRFAATGNVTVWRADVCDVPLPCTPYRVVANPPFARTAAILRRLLDDPDGGLVRADLVVQWQVARHRVRVSDGGPADLLGATWGPWWTFTRGRRLPAASFRPRPGVDAGVLVIARRDRPLVPVAAFARYAAFVRRGFEIGAGPPALDVPAWVARFARADFRGRPPA